ncbi:hypothetical protein Vafri_18472 [Volvox africanus]|uniref:Uncharacterized protein n=1 Tax=Volvox africanus TaxID=51714 RepID=A0A8J4FBU8_9CHLO|nr:hypothetical protein Vafri_18472 [Volvox africanus]
MPTFLSAGISSSTTSNVVFSSTAGAAAAAPAAGTAAKATGAAAEASTPNVFSISDTNSEASRRVRVFNLSTISDTAGLARTTMRLPRKGALRTALVRGRTPAIDLVCMHRAISDVERVFVKILTDLAKCSRGAYRSTLLGQSC